MDDAADPDLLERLRALAPHDLDALLICVASCHVLLQPGSGSHHR